MMQRCTSSDLSLEASTGKLKPADESSPTSPIPPAMLRSRCPIRMSFVWLPPTADNPIHIWGEGRTFWDDQLHHEPTWHKDPTEGASLEVVTFRYGEYYAHCLMASTSSDPQFVQLSFHCPHDGSSPRRCNCIDDPSFTGIVGRTQHDLFNKFSPGSFERKRDLFLKKATEEAQNRIELVKKAEE